MSSSLRRHAWKSGRTSPSQKMSVSTLRTRSGVTYSFITMARNRRLSMYSSVVRPSMSTASSWIPPLPKITRRSSTTVADASARHIAATAVSVLTYNAPKPSSRASHTTRAAKSTPATARPILRRRTAAAPMPKACTTPSPAGADSAMSTWPGRRRRASRGTTTSCHLAAALMPAPSCHRLPARACCAGRDGLRRGSVRSRQ
mmetsp:Transcript_3140/g.8957  ORF Transcript_3140/g.8957 Transcript_3140/m.8957 type:complete len:202 (-) Transcript_3140:77-682(-)